MSAFSCAPPASPRPCTSPPDFLRTLAPWQVSAMRISAIKQELDERGVGYRGLLEKSEFVDLLVDARAKGITAPPPPASGGDGGASASGEGGAGPKKDGFDPSYKEVEVCVGAHTSSAVVSIWCLPEPTKL